MKAKDIMTTTVATVTPQTPVNEIAQLLNERRISATPVVDEHGNLLGKVSEGDLVQRPETGGERHTSWWLSLVSGPTDAAAKYVKAHGSIAQDVMTRPVVSTHEQASLAEIAQLLEKNRIKRVPVLKDKKLVGIVSRADLLHGVIGLESSPQANNDDQAIRNLIDLELKKAGVQPEFINVVVAGGVVNLWGMVHHEMEKTAARVAAEQVPGVSQVSNHISIIPENVRALMGAE